MPTIENVDGFPTAGSPPALRRAQTLELGDSVLGSGTFGEVRPCVAIDGEPPDESLVVKILRDRGSQSSQEMRSVRKLQEKIAECNQHRATAGRQPIQSLPALRALPQLSFIGRLDGREVLGYVTLRLDTLGFVPFESILEEPELNLAFYSLDVQDRLMIAAELAAAFHTLFSELSFIHADLNPPNLFVDIAERRIAIIDFDGGAVMDGPDDRPETVGKRGQWMAPELEEALATSGPQEALIKVSRFSDAWAVFACVHNLLLPVDPFFFARLGTRDAIGSYLRRRPWPEADFLNDPLCDPEAEELYLAYRRDLDGLPKLVRDMLAAAINRGFMSPDRRPTSEQWALVLQQAIRPPRVERFDAAPAAVVVGMGTTLSWRVEDALELALDGGPVAAVGSLEVRPDRHQTYRLTARGRNRKVLHREVTVWVFPVPVLRSMTLPTLHFDARTTLRTLPVAPPAIQLPIAVDLAVRVAPRQPPRSVGDDEQRVPYTNLPQPPRYRASSFHHLFSELSEELRDQFSGGPP